jgi:hypothetical protein
VTQREQALGELVVGALGAERASSCCALRALFSSAYWSSVRANAARLLAPAAPESRPAPRRRCRTTGAHCRPPLRAVVSWTTSTCMCMLRTALA